MASASDLSQPRITNICNAGLFYYPPSFRKESQKSRAVPTGQPLSLDMADAVRTARYSLPIPIRGCIV